MRRAARRHGRAAGRHRGPTARVAPQLEERQARSVTLQTMEQVEPIDLVPQGVRHGADGIETGELVVAVDTLPPRRAIHVVASPGLCRRRRSRAGLWRVGGADRRRWAIHHGGFVVVDWRAHLQSAFDVVLLVQELLRRARLMHGEPKHTNHKDDYAKREHDGLEARESAELAKVGRSPNDGEDDEDALKDGHHDDSIKVLEADSEPVDLAEDGDEHADEDDVGGHVGELGVSSRG
mmetsp:Transcript_23587/g.75217  ORF Transcript_23587/g.75217 Transcript_23587/m.75217 type:complete len:236 (+) Transcript_23587:465-1172(+)